MATRKVKKPANGDAMFIDVDVGNVATVGHERVSDSKSLPRVS